MGGVGIYGKIVYGRLEGVKSEWENLFRLIKKI